MTSTDLSQKMVAFADKKKFPINHELRVLAEEFDTATLGFYADPQTVSVQKFTGCWSRARRCWCKYSGDALV